MTTVIRVGKAGNGTPCFLAPGPSKDLERAFGASWDNDSALWMYPAYFPVGLRVVKDFLAIKKSGFPLEFSDAAKSHIQGLTDTKAAYDQQALPSFSYVTPPYDHQRVGLNHIYYMWRAALFYAPGLGKSKIAIDYIRLLQQEEAAKFTVLILGPLVTIKNWGREIDLHSGKTLSWCAVLGNKKDKFKVIKEAVTAPPDIVLCTYDTAARYRDQLFEIPYTIVIADESHCIKDFRSNRTKAAYALGQKAVRKVIMTGTPTLGNPLDLYGQYRFLGDAFMPENYFHFKNKFLQFAPYNKHLVTGFKNLDVLNARTRFIAIRKKKEECLDLPDQTIVDIPYDLTNDQTVMYNQLILDHGLDIDLLNDFLGYGKSLPPTMEVSHIAVLLNKLRQVSSGFLMTSNENKTICDGCQSLPGCIEDDIVPYTRNCHVVTTPPPPTITVFDENPKIDAVKELLETILGDPDNKVIIWACYTAELDMLASFLEKEKLKFVRVDGKTGSKIQALVDTFNTDPDTRIYLAQISTGVGITLNSANYMIYFSLDYSLSSYEQSKDRNYRIGQNRNVTIYRLLCDRTLDPIIGKLLENKIDIDQALTNPLQSRRSIDKVVVRASTI